MRTARYMHIIILAMLLPSYGCIGSIIYQPSGELKENPSSVNVGYEDVHFTNASGNKLHGWWIPTENPRYTVLFCHGNGGNISHLLSTVTILHEEHLSLLLFDYGGYGNSEGSPSEKGTYRDGEAAWKYCVEERGIPPENMILWGRSLGGAVAIYLATKTKPAALVVESSFISLEKIVSDYTSCIFKPIGTGSKYENAELIRRVSVPVCVIHSRDDDVIPYYHGKYLYNAAPEPKKFITLSGSHNSAFVESRKWYTDRIGEFFELMEKGRNQ